MSESACVRQYKITKVCIDGNKNGVLEGRIYHYNSEFEGGLCFRSTIEFLNCMEFIMKTTHFPEYQECRAFRQTGEAEMEQPSPNIKREGLMATFVIRVLYRQHTSWQGTVRWCEKNQEINFRSVLELLLLIDSAIKE